MRKLTKKSHMFLYGISGMGVNMINLMVGSYLCSALLIGGFSNSVLPYQTYAQKDLVILALWSAFGVIAKIIDGIIDIPMAAFADNLNTRWGRRRPAILMGFIPMVIAYLLFLVVPDPSGATLGNTVYYGIVLCIFYSFYTLTMVTYYATFTEIVETERDRNYISNVKAVCDIVYFIMGYVGVRAMLNGMNVRIVALIVLPITLTMMIPFFLIREKGGEVSNKTEKVSLVDSLGKTMRNRPFVYWMVVYSFMQMGVQLFLAGINEYFSFTGMSMILVMMSSFAPVPLTLQIYNRIMKRKGFGMAIRYTLLSYSLSMFLLFILGLQENGSLKNILSVVFGLISSLSIGAIFSVAYSIPSQLASDEGEKTGDTNSAMYFAVQGLFAGVSTGIGSYVILNALKGTGSSGSGAIVYMTLFSSILTLVSFAFTFMLPKTVLRIGKE